MRRGGGETAPLPGKDFFHRGGLGIAVSAGGRNFPGRRWLHFRDISVIMAAEGPAARLPGKKKDRRRGRRGRRGSTQ